MIVSHTAHPLSLMTADALSGRYDRPLASARDPCRVADLLDRSDSSPGNDSSCSYLVPFRSQSLVLVFLILEGIMDYSECVPLYTRLTIVNMHYPARAAQLAQEF